MNNRSAAGLRRSAIVARIRLREEWLELKGPEETNQNKKTNNQIPEIIKKTQKPVRSASKVIAQKVKYTKSVSQRKSLTNMTNTQNSKNAVTSHKSSMDANTDVLRGVVALVDVGKETRALALRAALNALGATVVPAWSPLVTHLVWTEGGCRATRARARALACRLISPLWVEACASCGRRVPEAAFPAAARPSDLPSPRALRIMLKRAESENIPLSDLLNNANNKANKEPRLRISSDTEHDTSHDRSTDTSRDQSTDQTDTSHDQSKDTTDPEVRVNTLPRGGRAASPPPHPKSRRKLFTQKEAEISTADEDTPVVPKRMISAKLTQRERKDLARAERMARRLLGASTPAKTQILTQTIETPRIVLTGMSRVERQIVQSAIKTLNGRVQKQVNHHTTHVVLGSCQSSIQDNTGIHLNETTKIPSTNTRCGSTKKIPSIQSTQIPRCELPKARTLNALLGAARGCRVLHAQWVMDSLEVMKWLHHHGYEVPHLKKISQKARVERAALGRTCSEYAYDVFNSMKVLISPQTEQKDAAIQLLNLCGGVVQNGGDTQDGGRATADFDVDLSLGANDGEISSKWVFDSVAAGRMRTTRRYIVNKSLEGLR